MKLIEPHAVRTILVVRQHNQLGDMLCAIPALRALRETFPEARIRLVLSPLHHEIMNGCPFVDEILNYDKASFFDHPSRFVAFGRHLRTPHPDIAVVISTVSSSFTSNAMAWISGARLRIGPSIIAGKRNGSGFFFTHPIDLNWSATPERHQVERNLDTVRFLGADTDDFSLDIGITDAERQTASKILGAERSEKSGIIGFHPGAGKVPNRWAASSFACAAATLSGQFNARIVITAGPMDDEPLAAMTRAMAVPFTLIRGKTIREVAALIDCMDLYITNDTGTMHVAATTRSRVLSLFGPTNPCEWAPLGRRHRYLKGEGGRIDAISIEQVIKVAGEMLGE